MNVHVSPSSDFSQLSAPAGTNLSPIPSFSIFTNPSWTAVRIDELWLSVQSLVSKVATSKYIVFKTCSSSNFSFDELLDEPLAVLLIFPYPATLYSIVADSNTASIFLFIKISPFFILKNLYNYL